MSESGVVEILAAVAVVIAFLTGHWSGQQYCEKHTVITEGGGDVLHDMRVGDSDE